MDANAAEKMPYVKKAVASAKSVLSILRKNILGIKDLGRLLKPLRTG